MKSRLVISNPYSWGGLSAPPAHEPTAFGPTAWLLSLALARTARDALRPLVRKQLGRWRVVVLEEFRRKGRE